MEETFDFLTVSFFEKAEIYPGSVGTFRYRFQHNGKANKEDATIQVWVYENTSFELAQEIETAVFPWNEEGVEQIREYLQTKLKERGAQPYSIPYQVPEHRFEG